MNSILSNLLSTILGGIVVALFGFHFLNEREAEIEVSVYSQMAELDSQIFRTVFKEIILERKGELSLEDLDFLDTTIDRIGLGYGGLLQSYWLTNESDNAPYDVEAEIRGDGLVALAISDQTAEVHYGRKNLEIRVVPGAEAKLFVISSGTLSSPSSTYKEASVLFSSRGQYIQTIPYTEFSYYEDPVLAFPKNFPVLSLILSLLGAMLLAVLFLSAVVELATRRNTELLSRFTDDATIAKSLKVLYFLRSHEPERLPKIRRRLANEPAQEIVDLTASDTDPTV